jgi:hypothetical protein
MGSIKSNEVSQVHANHFDNQGRVVDVLTTLNQPRGTWQEDHNQADQHPISNQDARGAEARGESVITPVD